MKLLLKNKGITLVALVVTIIVLIILAGVSISLVLGQDGVVQKAKEGRDSYAEAARVENEQLANADVFTTLIDDTTPPTGTIGNMTNGDIEISGTVNLGENADLTKIKYVFTTTQEPLGTDDESLYKDGTISETVSTVKATKKAGTYYLHVFAIGKNGIKNEIISDTTATSSGKKDFSYTGNAQEISLTPGRYKLEVWGAQGGGYDSSYKGGKGGYSVGTINISSLTNMYAYVGQEGGVNSSVNTSSDWAFNGGGYDRETGRYCTRGGGGTDFSLQGGNWNSSEHLYSRVIVAGGGGAQDHSEYGNGPSQGSGGGTNGVNGSSTDSNGGYGGSQTSGGSCSSYSNGVGKFGMRRICYRRILWLWWWPEVGTVDQLIIVLAMLQVVVRDMYILHQQHQIIHRVAY